MIFASAFFDTNILLYSVGHEDDERRQVARALLSDGGAISVQTLNEMAAVMRSKWAMGWAEIDDVVNIFREELDVHPITPRSQALAMSLASQHMLNIYDANILASAQLAGFETVLSEDFSHRGRYGEVTVVNPFVL